jgi:hypothetical protein
MPNARQADLSALATRINEIARPILKQDGQCPAMLFLREPGGNVQLHELEAIGDQPSATREREIADAVSALAADAVVLVSEAWGAQPDNVPQGGRARDADDVEDVLLVAALDRWGNQVVLESRVARTADGAVRVVPRRTFGGEYVVRTFDAVRSAWSLPTRIVLRGVLSAELPAGWTTIDEPQTMGVDSGVGAAQFSVYRRDAHIARPGEASDHVRQLAATQGLTPQELIERPTEDGYVSIAQFADGARGVPSLTIAGVRVSPSHLILFTYTEVEVDGASRSQARRVFDSVAVVGAGRD